MPTFRFLFDDGSEPVVVDLADENEARYEAMRSSVEVTMETLSRDLVAFAVNTTVFNHSGKLICTVRSAEIKLPI